jgi:hypothetical protein
MDRRSLFYWSREFSRGRDYLREKDIRNEPLHRWLTWLDRDSPEGLVEEAIKMDMTIQKAEKKMEYVSIDKEALRAYQMREMALSDWTSGLNHARERKGCEKLPLN